MTDRPVYRLEEETPHFEIAGYSKTFGDVVEIFANGHPNRRVLFVADTIGHNPIYGNQIRRFVKYAKREKGWAESSDPKSEMASLEKLLPNKNNYPWSMCACSYTYLCENGVKLVNAALPRPLHINDNGVNEINIKGCFLGLFNYAMPSQHDIEMKSDDYLLVGTDGLYEGMSDFSDKDKTNKRFESLNQTLCDSRYLSARNIIESILESHGKYFLPKSREHDDVSFVVLKKIN